MYAVFIYLLLALYNLGYILGAITFVLTLIISYERYRKELKQKSIMLPVLLLAFSAGSVYLNYSFHQSLKTENQIEAQKQKNIKKYIDRAKKIDFPVYNVNTATAGFESIVAFTSTSSHQKPPISASLLLESSSEPTEIYITQYKFDREPPSASKSYLPQGNCRAESKICQKIHQNTLGDLYKLTNIRNDNAYFFATPGTNLLIIPTNEYKSEAFDESTAVKIVDSLHEVKPTELPFDDE